MTIKVSMAASVAGGETLSDAFSLDVSHASHSGTVAGNDHLVISLQPDTGEKVRLLFITADNYVNLSYKIQANTTPPEATMTDLLNLTEPHLFIGDTVKQIQAEPKYLAFLNADSDDIKVNIMVGRDAVVSPVLPPPSPFMGDPSTISRKSPSASGLADAQALEKKLEVAKNKLAEAQKAKANDKKLLKLNQDIEGIQEELKKARKK